MSALERTPVDAPFAAPWEAQVFAMVEMLRQRGLFTADEWSQTLAAVIRPHGRDEATADYTQWLEALEVLLRRHGVTDDAMVSSRRDAFLRAAAATPHGQPILIANDPRHGDKRD